jgi:predicted transcriptional regulator
MLQGDDEPVTASRLARVTGQAEAQIGNQLKKLMKVDLVERTQVLNKQGRGHAYAISVKYNAKAKRLVEAIEKAGRKSRLGLARAAAAASIKSTLSPSLPASLHV